MVNRSAAADRARRAAGANARVVGPWAVLAPATTAHFAPRTVGIWTAVV